MALSDQYRKGIGLLEPALPILIYNGYQHALWEVSQGLAKLFSHKKTIAILHGDEPSYAAIASAFSEDGYIIKSLKLEDFKDPSAWLAPIQNELLFVLFAQDDLVTGAIHDVSTLNATLKDKRVFRVSISHSAHQLRAQTRPEPFEVRILSLATERALLVAGERCRISSPVADRLPWRLDEPERVTAELAVTSAAEVEARQKRVLNFEKNLPDGFQPYFAADAVRVFDRAVIFHPGLDGSAVVDALAGAGVEKKVGGAVDFDSTSPCRWENTRFTDWLSEKGVAPEVIRGLVVLSVDRLDDQLNARLGETARHLLKLQNG
jgi:hypothetical protein